jgi:hypothetical protein
MVTKNDFMQMGIFVGGMLVLVSVLTQKPAMLREALYVPAGILFTLYLEKFLNTKCKLT